MNLFFCQSPVNRRAIPTWPTRRIHLESLLNILVVTFFSRDLIRNESDKIVFLFDFIWKHDVLYFLLFSIIAVLSFVKIHWMSALYLLTQLYLMSFLFLDTFHSHLYPWFTSFVDVHSVPQSLTKRWICKSKSTIHQIIQFIIKKLSFLVSSIWNRNQSYSVHLLHFVVDDSIWNRSENFRRLKIVTVFVNNEI